MFNKGELSEVKTEFGSQYNHRAGGAGGAVMTHGPVKAQVWMQNKRLPGPWGTDKLPHSLAGEGEEHSELGLQCPGATTKNGQMLAPCYAMILRLDLKAKYS